MPEFEGFQRHPLVVLGGMVREDRHHGSGLREILLRKVVVVAQRAAPRLREIGYKLLELGGRLLR
ncbi:MAG: hypothetical protein IIB09_06600 [Bacteroidetes bacterium]|nr:hypothetical protein [Bacteroidota bacterium]